MNLLTGLANLISLGQAAFYGIGAYISALVLVKLNLTFLPAIIIAMSVTAIIGLMMGFISLRLSGDYFILATLGFQIIIYSVLYNWVELTNGPYGIHGIPEPDILGYKIKGVYGFLILSTFLCGFVIILFYKLIHSPFGRNLKAMRDDEISLMILGRNTTALKIQAFVISSGFTAISGFLYAGYISYIDPTSFTLEESLFILSALVIGGAGTIRGSIIGAVFVIVLPEILRFVGMPSAMAANLRLIIYGMILCVLMYYRPQGIAGDYRF